MANETGAITCADDDINILLLGPTGIGKTTFINAFANYLQYTSLDAAANGELQCPIPAWFIYTDKDTFEEHTVMVGEPDDNEEKGTPGASCTRQCRSFVFVINNRKLRLIDTPGIGDTKGVLQDEKNFEDILAYIAQLDHLSGICILLKPNEERMSILFRYCVKELLRHLNVQVKNNLMFVFTNARSTNYQLGGCAPLLRELLRSLRDQSSTEVPFSRENAFILDNEAFRYLLLLKNNIRVDPADKESYTRSWDHTIKEFSRLVARIVMCEKHPVSGVLSLNEAQQLIRKLSRPISEIATLIQQNLQLAREHRQNIEANRTPMPQILVQNDFKVVQLGHPRTVSTNAQFTRMVKIDGVQQIDYTSHCHPHCRLRGVEADVIGHEKLRYCAAMDERTLVCTQCRCPWKEHKHITYELRRFQIQETLTRAGTARSALAATDQRIEDLEKEQEKIVAVCAKLTQFLRANALNPVNDDIVEYIQHFIREERTKKAAGATNDAVIEGLEQLMKDYKQELTLVQQQMRAAPTPLPFDQTSSMTSADIFMLVGTLYQLPINGQKIRAQVEEIKQVQARCSHNRERIVAISADGAASPVFDSLRNVLT